MGYFRRIFIAIDQLLNTFLGGWPDETFSARCWRWHMKGIEWPRRLVNYLVWWQKDHCYSAYGNELKREQTAEDYRALSDEQLVVMEELRRRDR